MKTTLTLAIAATIGISNMSYANIVDNIPTSDSNSALYYQLGGGRSVPVPPVENNVSVPINAQGDVSLGFSCGKFNPVTTITNSLNDFKDSTQNISGTIVSNAERAIVSFPMYKLAQSDPKLYNILNNNVLGARNQYALNMKSCELMQQEALKGKNPYNQYITMSRNNNMKTIMVAGDGDLNKAMAKVNSQQGQNGISWATPGHPLGAAAGGEGQPPIQVIHDTAVAGYNVMLGRHVTETSAPDRSDKDQVLLNYWSTPQKAAEWITSVVGDQIVTTCSGSNCHKGSTQGVGLLPYIQLSTQDVQKNLVKLVSDPNQVNAKSLMNASAPGQVISPAVLQDIRLMNHNAQSNTIATLSQNIATTRIVNEALLSINILQMGSQVPNIHAVGPAQVLISKKIQLMKSYIDQIMYSINIRRKLTSNVMADIVKYNAEQNSKAEMIPRLGDKPAVLEDGAIVKRDQKS